MGRGLFPIAITLIIAAVVLGVWMFARQQGIRYQEEAENVEICVNQNKDTLLLKWKGGYDGLSGYGLHISGEDKTLHLSFKLVEGDSKEARHKVKIDTATIKYIEVYGRKYSIDEISTCQ